MLRPSISNAARQSHRKVALGSALFLALCAPPASAQQAAPRSGPPPVVQPPPAASSKPSSSAGTPGAATTSTPASKSTISGTTSTGELPNLPMEAEVDITDTHELPDRTYYFLGLRYRGTVIPQFIENLFVDDGGTVYSNSLGIELDIRKGGNSLIPWITYTDYNTGDILFLQKGQQDVAANRSIVNSSLKAIYLGVDELWSVPLVPTKLDFEIGFGVGIGGIFGTLSNNWVYVDNTVTNGKHNGELQSSNGKYYSKCPSTGFVPPNGDTTLVSDGCSPGNHSSPNPAKVFNNGHYYIEPNWFNNGSVPVVFPTINVPELGLRYKPIKQLEVRADMGFGLTGFWFGLGVDYGFEKAESPDTHKAGLQTRFHDTL
jgi:hypothetical protein